MSKYNIIVGSKNALLTDATKPDVSDMISQEWFYVATSISNFSGFEWDGRCWRQKGGIFHFILCQKNENVVSAVYSFQLLARDQD